MKKEQEIKSDNGKVIVPARAPTLEDYDNEYDQIKAKMRRVHEYQAGGIVQSKNFGNYDMGRGKGRRNGATSSQFKVTQDDAVNIDSCAMDCDMDFNC